MYFVTFCTANRELLFGEVMEGEVVINRIGQIVADEWQRTPILSPNVGLDEFVVMPNHFHGIVAIVEGRGTARRAPTPERFGSPVSGSLPTIVRSFKSAVTSRINILHGTPGASLWQRNYHEHVIRNENDLHRIREYIQTNPMRWELDQENPKRRGEDAFEKWLESFAKKGG
jgi:REP element-mobilizing transposase RayT